MKDIIFITIGEAPRTDIANSFARFFADNSNVKQEGLLNGLSYDEAIQLLGADDSESLVSTFCDGTSLEMSKAKVQHRLQDRIYQLQQSTIAAIVVLCTAEFDQLKTQTVQLIEPEKVLLPYIQQQFRQQKIGVVLPLENQIQAAKKKWEEQQLSPIFTFASPYDYSPNHFSVAGKKLQEQGVEIIILDCMGYSQKMKKKLEQVTQLPVYQSNELLFEYVKKLL